MTNPVGSDRLRGIIPMLRWDEGPDFLKESPRTEDNMRYGAIDDQRPTDTDR